MSSSTERCVSAGTRLLVELPYLTFMRENLSYILGGSDHFASWTDFQAELLRETLKEFYVHAPYRTTDMELENVCRFCDLLTTLRVGDGTMIVTTALPGRDPRMIAQLHNMPDQKTRQKLMLTLGILQLVSDSFDGQRLLLLDFAMLRSSLNSCYVPVAEGPALTLSESNPESD